MDQYNARYYLDGMPLPIIIVEKRTGCILYANARATDRQLKVGGNMFSLMRNKQDFSAVADAPSATERTVDMHIGGTAYRVRMAAGQSVYRGAACLLITVTAMSAADTQSDAEVVSQICSIYTDNTVHKKALEFLRIGGESTGAFCVTLYEKRSRRYVMKEEWRSRKSVCVPVLQADIETDTAYETSRIKAFKRAADVVCVPFLKPGGVQGAAVYCFDRPVDQALRDRISGYVDLFVQLSQDGPVGRRRETLQQGLDALSEGIVIWEPDTRRLLLANKAYRTMFGYKNPRHINSEIGPDVRPGGARRSSEEYTDVRGRFFRITHTRGRQRGRTVITSIIIDMTAQKNAEAQLEAMAKTDALTGLPNRRAGIEQLRKMYRENKGRKRPLTVCFADIDGLKYINDTYGHGAGDSMIRAVADVLKKHVQPAGAVCRLGGDEFVLILPGMRRAQALLLTAAIERDTAKCLVGQAQGIAMSFGFKEAEYVSDETADTLVNVADYEMYREKRKKSVRAR